MAPGICMTDFPMPRTDAAYPYARRRQRNRLGVGIGGKYRTHEMIQKSITRAIIASPHDPPSSSPMFETNNKSTDANFPTHLKSSLCARMPIQHNDQWFILKRREGILNIIARTIALVRRNHILEKKVEALTLETRTFVNSVLSNPENTARNKERRREFSLRRDGKINESVNSMMDQKSWSSSIIDNHVEETRRRNVTDRDDKIFFSMENETRSLNTIVH